MALKLQDTETPQCSIRSLAVPFPGAMALKHQYHRCMQLLAASCSPLPRGDGAETDYAAADMFAFFSICAMPGPFSWLSACRLDDSMYSNILHKAYCTQTGFCMKSGYICEVKNLSLEHRSGCSHWKLRMADSRS